MSNGQPPEELSPLSWMRGAHAGPLQRFIRDQRILFLLVGGLNTAFSTLVYAAFVVFLGPEVPAIVSLCIAWVISVCAVFFVYRKLVFRVSGNFVGDFIRFCSVNLLSLGINLGLLAFLADFIGWPAIPTQIGITVVVVIFNYIGHKYFSFRRNRGAL